LEEQKRIAGILDAADILRAKRREALARLDDLLQSTFLDLFGDPVTNPKGWEEVELGDHTSKVGSGATPRGGNESYKTEGISLIRSLNVRDGKFKLKNLAFIDDEQAAKLSNAVVETNDVLLNITGASVARVCRAPSFVIPARVNQHVCIIRPTQMLESNFLEKTLLSPSMKNNLLRIGESGATRQAITKAQVLSLLVPFPPLELQQRFAEIVSSVEEQKAKMIKHLGQLDDLFASLQQRAFRGDL
jgi:type I restriction enzyme S subunit